MYGLHKHVGILLLVDGGGYPSCSFHLDPSLRRREDRDPSRAVGTTSSWVGNTAWCQQRAGRLTESFRRLETGKSSRTHWAPSHPSASSWAASAHPQPACAQAHIHSPENPQHPPIHSLSHGVTQACEHTEYSSRLKDIHTPTLTAYTPSMCAHSYLYTGYLDSHIQEPCTHSCPPYANIQSPALTHGFLLATGTHTYSC